MNFPIKSIIVDDEPTARKILEIHLQSIPSIELVAVCKNALEAFKALNENQIDLIFLDIDMPDISGLSLAKSISNDTKVIFTTAHREYAIEGFELQAIDYLLKPISLERLFKAVEVYKKRTSTPIIETKDDTQIKDFAFVKSDRKMIKIKFNEIQYIESQKDYLKIYLNNEFIMVRESISHFESILPSKQFLRIHRSFIIQVKKIDAYTHELIEIKNQALPIGRQYKQSVLDQLNKLQLSS
ncbi:LytR/AlgR family response regulator transcription factor [Aureibacter tunicatorum]|uniref:DNA-binding LytR/AlgR family response regulator n=1 Tax=Aureibacter tunicatorum TaxID=866807 RepID=A0AAE3XPX2_9BACT|nr:LytTR family DNA-binding domain-containing protein [Aureibacter tunicatorum]MDR6239880.1 DNA-binding LytR/AlgR family response regulator [Aureibacter tunicatorum]BDD04355.1 DNA-binding response regulator [Aureibacter tunicatorum]